MVGKDQTIGGVIFIVCVAVALLYVLTLFDPGWFSIIGYKPEEAAVQFWVIAVPVFIAFVAIMGIGAWIGWTMATTPPPKPIEEITTEIEEEKVTTEEQKEEPKTTEESPVEEKKPEKRKKGEK